MAKKGKTPLNLSLPADLVDAARLHFSTLGKGSMSACVERQIVRYLRQKHAKLPERYALMEGAK